MYNNHIITVYTEVEDIANVVLILSTYKRRRQQLVIHAVILYGHGHLYRLVAQLDFINLSVQVLIDQKCLLDKLMSAHPKKSRL